MKKTTLILVIVGLVALSTPVYSVIVTWFPFQQLTTNVGYHFQPEVIQASDGKAWVFWQFSTFDTPGAIDIYYRTYDFTSWSPQQTLTTDPGQDIAPSAAQMPNGTLFVSFSSNRNGNFDIYLKRYNAATGWSPDLRITTDPANDELSSMVAAGDGSLWVFWNRKSTNTDLYYKVYRNQAWSSEARLTTNPVPDASPTAYQMKDGRIWVAWSRTLDSQFKKVHIFYMIYNGVTWSGEVQKTSNSNPDRHPELLQDTNGTIWLLWSRELSLPAQEFQDDIYYVTSSNNGVNWSAETRLTNDSSDLDDIQSSAAQLKDHRIWVFWASDRDPDSIYNIHYSFSTPLPAHDVAVASLTAAPLKLRRGGPVSITVTVENRGTFPETFTLTVQAANATTVTIATQSVSLSPGASQTFTYTWSTIGLTPGKYMVTATASQVIGESASNLDDNSRSVQVWLVPPGDVDLDGDVDIIDASTLALAFGSRPGYPSWNPDADLDGNGVVDISDAATMALWFGYRT